MASLATICRLSARSARSKLSQDAARRAMSTSSSRLAASNFTMPALSPTMTEGNISTWRVKEGDSFSAGDVLLEIETDKATMDVEAQEDGIMFKIMSGDGTKSVPVGTRIAVLAEEGDDIKSLEVPPDEKSAGVKESKKPQEVKEASEEQRREKNEADTPVEAQKKTLVQEEDAKEGQKKSEKMARKKSDVLLPAVEMLLKQNGIDKSEAHKIPGTGPNGRLLKGDVLVYLGKVSAKVTEGIESRLEKLSQMDLSNIKVAPQKESAKIPAAADEDGMRPPPSEEGSAGQPALQISLPISLASVFEAQRKVQTSLGVSMPLATFVNRAIDVANDALPLPAGTKPTADELFYAVLGLNKAGPKGSRGHYVPQLSAFPERSVAPASPSRRKTDVIDLLSAAPGKGRSPASSRGTAGAPGLSADLNTFSLLVPKAEETRAKVFLERVKYVLETEPGRLVL